MYWIVWQTSFGSISQPVKPRYGNYYARGYSNRWRKSLYK